MVRRPTRAQRTPRTRPRRGPGPGKRFPTWAVPFGPLVVSRPSASNGHAWNPVEQKCRRRPGPNPSIHSFSPLPLPCRATPRWHRHGPCRRCARPPMGGRATVERLLGRALPVRHSTSRRRPVERREEDGAATGPLAGTRPPMGGRVVVKRLLGRALPARPWIHPQPVVAATGSSQKGESCNLLLHLQNRNHLLLFSSSPI
jgi:hypothetical protein